MEKDQFRDEIKNRFKHYPPRNPTEIQSHEDIRRVIRNTALDLIDFLPKSVINTREFSQVLTDLENAMYHANAAYARHKPEPE